MSEAAFSLPTLRAMARGKDNTRERMEVTFIKGETVLTGTLLGMGSRLGVIVSGELHEDIHPNRVISARII
ncbi:hypothetical protein ACG2OD_14680 [Streptomyces sp. PDY-4]|uniref:hypothetical protein n=1 Tax=Streptomyces sp. PDY-4 TaxID=3376070 RepID=UPI0037A77EDF